MAAEKSQTEAAITTIESPAPSAVASCGWMKPKAKDGTFVTKFKDQFYGFLHAPMDEHKACFKTTIQKMVGRFSLPKEGDNKDEKKAIEAQAASRM